MIQSDMEMKKNSIREVLQEYEYNTAIIKADTLHGSIKIPFERYILQESKGMKISNLKTILINS